jgi:proteasome lid subunit RPN8/RPN11
MTDEERNNVIGIERARRNAPIEDGAVSEGLDVADRGEVLPEAIDSAEHVLGWVLGKLGQQIHMDDLAANHLGVVIVVNSPTGEVEWASSFDREQAVRAALAEAIRALSDAEASP